MSDRFTWGDFTPRLAGAVPPRQDTSFVAVSSRCHARDARDGSGSGARCMGRAHLSAIDSQRIRELHQSSSLYPWHFFGWRTKPKFLQ